MTERRKVNKKALHNLGNGLTFCLECLNITEEEAEERFNQNENLIIIQQSLLDFDTELFPYGDGCEDCEKTVIEPIEEYRGY